MKILKDKESGQEVAKQSGQASTTRFHVDYWKERLYRKTYTRDGVSREVPEWSVRLQQLGRREAFALDSVNASVAATKAKEIATFLDANGWDATLVKYKPDPFKREEICTVGAFLADVQARSHLHPRTFKGYAMKLRKMVADIARVDSGVKGKARHAKHDYVNGGHRDWLAKVDSQRLDVLTPDSVNAWRNGRALKGGSDPLKRKSAERTAASCIRCARALFSPEITDLIKVKLPPSPFAGVKLHDPGPQRYHSDINPEWLLACAEDELRAERPQLYLALFLCLWAGLRRKEADLLTWQQVDLEAGQIHVRRTQYFEPKTEESQRDIDLAPAAVEVLRSLKAGCSSEFVLNGGDPDPSATWPYYRANCTWRKLVAWLKGKGISQRNAVHVLRKESGSLIASNYGIEAARQHLGHRDIRITSSTYVSKKRRVEVSLPIGAAGQLRAAEG